MKANNKTNNSIVEFVSYDGAYPNLCRGVLTVKVDGKEYKFGYYWDRKDGEELLDPFWASGGCVSFDNEWNESVTQDAWVLSDFKKSNYPPEIGDRIEDILEVMNQNVPYGCCGGCV